MTRNESYQSRTAKSFGRAYRVASQTRKVGFGLAVAIFFLPWVATWFLLRKGYSANARVAGFSWLAFVISIFAMAQSVPHAQQPLPPAAPVSSSKSELAIDPTSPAYQALQADADAIDHPLNRTSLETVRLWRDDDGYILFGDFAVRNDNKFDIKDVELICSILAPSGTLIGVNRQTIYDIVRSHRRRVFRGINLGFVDPQTSNVDCILGDAQVAD